MRKRKIQSISLKLCELKEYDAAKQERQLKSQSHKDRTADTASSQQSPLTKVGTKSKQEIRERIGFINDL